MKSMFCGVLLATLAHAPMAAQAPAGPAPEATAPVIPDTPAAIAVGSRVGELPTGYDSGGRRDPFTSLVAPTRSLAPTAGEGRRPPAGLAGVALADVIVRGILRSGPRVLAILEGPNRQSYVTRVNDRLFDAVVVAIEADGVIFGDPGERGGATSHQRKALRPAGDQVP